MPAAWPEVALRTSDTWCFQHDMQIGAESNLNSPTPRVRARRQLPFRAFTLSTVVGPRVYENVSQFCLSTVVRCEVCMSSVLVDQVLRRYFSVCCADLAGEGPEIFPGYIESERLDKS